MAGGEDLLKKIYEASPEAREAWEVFVAAQRVYLEALRAMGLLAVPRQEVASSAQVRVAVSSADLIR